MLLLFVFVVRLQACFCFYSLHVFSSKMCRTEEPQCLCALTATLHFAMSPAVTPPRLTEEWELVYEVMELQRRGCVENALKTMTD